MAVRSQPQVDRPVLAGRVARALESGSVLLLAEAGFGKTTALEQALALRGDSPVWLRLTAADREPGRLVARLLAGIRAELPGLADEYADQLSAALEPIDVGGLVDQLAGDPERLLVDPLVFALDDAEHLAGAGSLGVGRSPARLER